MAEPEKIEDANGEVGAQEPDTPDYADESIEDLEARFRAGEGQQVEEDIPPAPEPEPEPAPEPESLPEVAASEDENTPGVEVPPPDEPDERDLQFQEMQLEMERIRQERERFEYQTGRATGEVGFLKKELERLRAAPPPQDDPIDYEPAETARPAPTPSAPSHLEEQVAELRAEQTASAVQRVYSEFLTQVEGDLKAQGVEQDNIPAEQESIIEQITPTLKERFEPFGDVSTLGAKSLQKVTRMVLQGAYTDQKLAKIANLRKQASERKASQIAETKIIKQAASPSGSSGRAVQEPPPKTPEQMTAEEADAEMIRLFGDHGG